MGLLDLLQMVNYRILSNAENIISLRVNAPSVEKKEE